MDDFVRNGIVSKEQSMSNITSEASRNAQLRDRIRHHCSFLGVKESEKKARGEDQSSESYHAHINFNQKGPTFSLKFRTTSDFRNLLENNVAQAKEEFENQKLMISSSIATSLKIGDWEVKTEFERELNVKFFHAAEKLVWEISEKGLKSRMEIQFSNIVGINAHAQENGVGILQLVLIKPPAFFQEENPKSRKHPHWKIVTDFTQGYASTFRMHYATFPVRSLDENYANLLKFNDLLAKLSKKPFSNFGSPYFHQAPDVNIPRENQFQQPIYHISSFPHAGQSDRHISEPIYSMTASTHPMLDQVEGMSRNQIESGQSDQDISELFSMRAPTYPILDQVEERSNQYDLYRNQGRNNNNAMNLQRTQIEPAAPWTSSSRIHPAYFYQNTETPGEIQNYLTSSTHLDWFDQRIIHTENPFMSAAGETGTSFPQKELTQDNLAANVNQGLSNMQYLPSSHTSFQAYDGYRPSSRTFSQHFNEHLPLETPHVDPVWNNLEEIMKNT